MKIDNPFDKKIEIWRGKIPSETCESAVYVNDTLDLCWASASSVFGDRATPEIALAIYDRVVSRAEMRKKSTRRMAT